MDLRLAGKVAIVTGSSRGLGRRARRRSPPRAAASLCGRGADASRLRRARSRDLRRPGRVSTVRPTSRPPTASTRSSRPRRALRRPDILVNNIGLARGADLSRRPTPTGRKRSTRRFSGHPASRPRCRTCARAAAASSSYCVDLRPRDRRPHDLQRGEGRRDQPGQVAGAAAGERQHPREQRGARARSSSRAARGGSASRPTPSGSQGSSSASCRSAASARPRRSATSSPSWPRPRRAGLPAPASSSTAARAAPFSAPWSNAQGARPLVGYFRLLIGTGPASTIRLCPPLLS